MDDSRRDRRYPPTTESDREPILKKLQQNLPATGNILEIVRRTGKQACF